MVLDCQILDCGRGTTRNRGFFVLVAAAPAIFAHAASYAVVLSAVLWGGLLCANVPAQDPTAETSTDPSPRLTARGDEAKVTTGDKTNPRPCSFQQVTPGQSRLDEVLQRLGQPREELENDRERVLVFQVEPFSKVEVFVSHDVVASIVMHLKEPASCRQIAEELGIEEFEPVQVLGETGQILGRVYPERGLLLNFATEAAASQVTELVLDPITAEPFVLRVQQDARHRYERNLEDLETALRLEPDRPDALRRKAEILAAVGRATKALKTIDQALQLAPTDDRCRLLRARLLFQWERHDEATTLVKDVIAAAGESTPLRAGAECLYGALLAGGPRRNHNEAITHHLAAIKLASPLATDPHVDVRREAKAILLDAFLGAAHDIAAGNWQQRPETTAKWLGSARELADALITQDQGDKSSPLRVQCANLAAQADLESSVDPAQLLASIEQEAKRLADESGDPMFRQSLDLVRAKALLDAASVEQGRQAAFKAFDYAQQATELLDPVLEQRELVPGERLFVGQLYFFVGSCQAVVHGRHDEAVRWYERARGFLTDTLPPSAGPELGRHGERFVSMGASYWETSHREEALELTRRGLEMMKQAARQGLIHEERLSLPYGNLAAMYKLLGRSEEAKNFAEIAGRIRPSPQSAPRSSPVRR